MQITIVMINILGFEKPCEFVFSFTNKSLVLNPLNTSSFKLLKKVIFWHNLKSRKKLKT